MEFIRDKEYRDVDPVGNRMPDEMYFFNGFYYVRVTVNGKRPKKSTGKKDFKSAMRRYTEIMVAWNDKKSGWENTVTPTLKEYWENEYRPTWTVGVKTPIAGHPHDYRDDTVMKAPLADLGHYRMGDITTTIGQKWANARRVSTYQKRKDGPKRVLAEGTIARELSLLQAIFEKARKAKVIKENPWEDVPRARDVTREQVVEPEEQVKLEAALSPRYRRWFHFMLGTGLRCAEGRAVEKQHVNFEKRYVTVTRKTRGLKKKVQKVPLIDDFLLDVLREQLTVDGQLWPAITQQFRDVLAEAAKKAQVRHLSPHTLRHTFATRYLKGGGDIYILSKILGHSNVSMTERVYAHLLSDDLLARSKGVMLGLRPTEGAGA